MLKAFRTNTPLQLAIITVTLLLLWVPSLIDPVPMPRVDSFSPIYNLFYIWLGSLPRLATAIAMIVVTASALYFNKLLVDAQIVSNSTLLPTLLYIIAMSMTPGRLTLTPLVIVSALMVVCTKLLLLKGTLLTIEPEKTFGITALIGICTLIYMPAYSLLVSFLLIIVVYRLYNWRDWMMMILGFLAPYIFYATYLYITDGLAEVWQQIMGYASNIGLRTGKVNTVTGITCGYMVILFVVAAFATLSIVNERTVVIQKNVTAISLLMVSGAIMLCYTLLFPTDLQTMALPFALQTTIFLQYMERGKRPWIWDIVLTLAIIAATAYNYIT
ncbi:MAG: hypothetical protein K5650_03310 [Bacteroidales bacterium]|nr:hypothetical protein [Bacteroidales bacterium]